MDSPFSDQPSAVSFQQQPLWTKTIPLEHKYEHAWSENKAFPEEIPLEQLNS
jgi:hypothetical protein